MLKIEIKTGNAAFCDPFTGELSEFDEAIECKRLEENDYSGGDNTDFDMENDNCIDTGIEWEVYSIVKLTESEG